MDINSEYAKRHSEDEFARQLITYMDSGIGVIHVRTNELQRAAVAIRRQILLINGVIKEWDVANGFRTFTKDNLQNALLEGDGNVDIMSAFSAPLDAIKKDPQAAATTTAYCFVSPHVFMENNPVMSQLLSVYSHVLPSTETVIILLTPDAPLPQGSANVLTIRFDPPGLGELRESLTAILKGVESDFDDGVDLPPSDLEKICYVGAGMTKNQFEMYTALSVVEAGRNGQRSVTVEDIIRGVSVGKTDVVSSNDILELYPPGDIKNVGGLENLKGWVAKRRHCYSDDAREFGVEPPKGIVLVGIPGSGKSLVARAISSELGVPLVRLDFGRVFNSLVGASEERMRTALHMVESMSPVCLLCDEIDKGLGGIGGSGDSGTSNRVLGSFLTWLQDCKHPVFVVVTANNVTGLPPEMMRRGRFDAIFSTTLPTPAERREVLDIHLRLRHRNIADFPKAEVEEVVHITEGYVPSEIESAVKDALVDAFSENTEMTMAHVKAAVQSMIPLSKAFAEQIAAMTDWAEKNATPAGKLTVDNKAILANSRRVSTRSRR